MEIPVNTTLVKKELADGSILLYWHRTRIFVTSYIIEIVISLCFFIPLWHLIELFQEPDFTFDGDLHYLELLVAVIVFAYILLSATYKLIRRRTPESIHLTTDFIHYDTGTPLPSFSDFFIKTHESSFDWKNIFRKQMIYSNIERQQLVLDQNPSRIYFDQNMRRIVIGRGLSEPEIDWLYSVIQS